MDKYEKLRNDLFQILGDKYDMPDNVIFNDEAILKMVTDLKQNQCGGVGDPFKVLFCRDDDGVYHCNRVKK